MEKVLIYKIGVLKQIIDVMNWATSRLESYIFVSLTV